MSLELFPTFTTPLIYSLYPVTLHLPDIPLEEQSACLLCKAEAVTDATI